MTGKTHQTIGLVLGIGSYLYVAAPQYGPATLAAVTAVSSLSALLPDIDSPAGKIYTYVPLGSGHDVERLVNPFLKHRNLTHSLLGFIIVTLLFHRGLEHLPTYWGIDAHKVFIAGAVAYASHLLADSVTVEGIPVLFPYPKMYGFPPHPFQGLRIETGKWFENFIVYPAVNIALGAMILTRWGEIRAILFK
jgi:membrane-bound metal-dependent hydrolase YbcI (DUF457 family)